MDTKVTDAWLDMLPNRPPLWVDVTVFVLVLGIVIAVWILSVIRQEKWEEKYGEAFISHLLFSTGILCILGTVLSLSIINYMRVSYRMKLIMTDQEISRRYRRIIEIVEEDRKYIKETVR